MGNQLNFWNVLDGHVEEERETAPPPPPAPAKTATNRPARKSSRAMRKCLGQCGKPFLSSGPGNRFCGNCRRHEAFADGAPEYSAQF